MWVKIIVAIPGLIAAAWLGPRVGAGDPAVDFKLKNLKGEDVSLRQFHGKVVLLDFWATWCAASKESLPEFARLSERYREDGFVLLAINIDNQLPNAARFLRANKIDIVPLWDGRKKVISSYEVEKMPTAYLIDRNGIVRYVNEGYAESDIQALEEQIRRLLNDRAPAALAGQ